MKRILCLVLLLIGGAHLFSDADAATPRRARLPLLRRECANGSCSIMPEARRRPGPAPVGAIAGTIGGPTSPDNKDEVACDLPVSQRKRNVGGRDGAGLCVFTSIMHAARWQNEPLLQNFQQDMQQERGGGYPEKVDTMIAKYGKGTRYMQYEGRDDAILEAAIRSGRMPSVTYNGRDPHYGNQSIAHMVSLVGYDRKNNWACVLDNNFIGEKELVWLSLEDFLSRWRGGGSMGWTVVLLTPPPPPPPHN